MTATGNLPLGEPSTGNPILGNFHRLPLGNFYRLPLANSMTATRISIVHLRKHDKERSSPIFTVPYSFPSAGAAKAALMTSFPAPGCLATLRGLNGQRDAEAYLWPDAVNLEGFSKLTFSLNFNKNNVYTQLDGTITYPVHAFSAGASAGSR